MHELAICQSVMDQVQNIALERNAQCVTSIVVGMGRLSGVEAQLLNLRDIASTAPVVELSAKDKSGMPHWINWIDQQIEARIIYLEEHPVKASHTHEHHHAHDESRVV